MEPSQIARKCRLPPGFGAINRPSPWWRSLLEYWARYAFESRMSDSPTIKIDQLFDPEAHTIFTECLTSGMTESTTV